MVTPPEERADWSQVVPPSTLRRHVALMVLSIVAVLAALWLAARPEPPPPAPAAAPAP